jgi:hypothetical protein
MTKRNGFASARSFEPLRDPIPLLFDLETSPPTTAKPSRARLIWFSR